MDKLVKIESIQNKSIDLNTQLFEQCEKVFPLEIDDTYKYTLQFRNCIISKVTFYGAMLKHYNITSIEFINCKLEDICIHDINYSSHNELENINFISCDIVKSKFYDIKSPKLFIWFGKCNIFNIIMKENDINCLHFDDGVINVLKPSIESNHIIYSTIRDIEFDSYHIKNLNMNHIDKNNLKTFRLLNCIIGDDESKASVALSDDLSKYIITNTLFKSNVFKNKVMCPFYVIDENNNNALVQAYYILQSRCVFIDGIGMVDFDRLNMSKTDQHPELHHLYPKILKMIEFLHEQYINKKPED